MKVQGKHFRTLWIKETDSTVLQVIDQRYLPHKFVIEELNNVNSVCTAIKEMHIRGAGLIGAVAAYGMYLGALEAPRDQRFDDYLLQVAGRLKQTRPTAVNLEWAVTRQLRQIGQEKEIAQKIECAFRTAKEIEDEDASFCQQIGIHGAKLIEEISRQKGGKTVNILTHCNAGWLAFVDYGTATAPVYQAQKQGLDIHVWVDETRPRNQGASLTAFELQEQGVPYTVIPDNVGGHLMQHGQVDLVLVGSDRTTFTGDVCNKIGTYLKALAAFDNGVPFYACLPSSTIDWNMRDGVKEIPIEQRGDEEVKYMRGMDERGKESCVLVTPALAKAANFGFDVTPARLVSGIITERGVAQASEQGMLALYPEKRI